MEPGGTLAFQSPHLSILSLGESGDNWVFCAASKTQGPFSVTVPRGVAVFVSAAIFPGQGKGAGQARCSFFRAENLPGFGDCGNIHSDTKLVTGEAATMTTECNLRTKRLSSSSGGGCAGW